MTEINKIIKLLKENLTLILLVIYSVSFTNYFIYYKSFNISIFNYINVTDLIFFTLEYIFKITLIIFIYEVTVFIIFTFLFNVYERIVLLKRKKLEFYLKSKKNKKKIEKLFLKPFQKGLLNTKFFLFFLGVFILPFLPYKLIIFPAYFIYIIYLLELGSKERMFKFSIPFVSIIIFISMIVTTLFNSYSKRFEKEDYFISFKQDSKAITTSKSSHLNYLGETSTYIFLYDISTRKSKIYQKSSLTNIEVQNNGRIDEYIFEVKEFYPVKLFIDWLNEKKNTPHNN